jgi:hypothetical protein
MDKIKNYPGFTFEGKGSSSIGRLRYNNDLIVYIKPSDLQGGKSHGKENESLFFNKIHSFLIEKDTICVNLESRSTNLEYKEIVEIEDSSLENSTQYQKSDIILYNRKGEKIGISLKKDGNFRWESSKTRYKEVYNNFIKKAKNNEIPNLILQEIEGFSNKYKMINPRNSKPYSKIIIDDFPENDVHSIVFGSESPNPIIISRSFTDDDFNTEDNIIRIQCSEIYMNISDIEKHNLIPVMVFAHHAGKKHGIDFRAIPKYKTIYGHKANILHINYQSLMQ